MRQCSALTVCVGGGSCHVYVTCVCRGHLKSGRTFRLGQYSEPEPLLHFNAFHRAEAASPIPAKHPGYQTALRGAMFSAYGMRRVVKRPCIRHRCMQRPPEKRHDGQAVSVLRAGTDSTFSCISLNLGRQSCTRNAPRPSHSPPWCDVQRLRYA